MQENIEKQMEHYLLGKLTGKELSDFRVRLNTDASFATDFEQHRLALQVIDGMGDLEMMKQIKEVHQQALPQTPTSNTSKIWRLSIAAGLLALCALAIWLWFLPSPSNDLFAQYYQPYELNFSSRGAAQDQLLAKAQEYYKIKNYAQAAPLFEQALAADANNTKIKLALAISLLEAQKEKEALQKFNEISSKSFDLYKSQSQWYAALIYLRQKDTERAIPLLKILAQDTDAVFNKSAVELLDKIKQ